MRARTGHAHTHAWQEKGNKTLITIRKINSKTSYSSNSQMSASIKNTQKLALHTTPPIPADINNEQKKIHSKSK